MKIKIVKHFQPDDKEFHGDFYVTVEVGMEDALLDDTILATFLECNTDAAEAYALGYCEALLDVGHITDFDIIFSNQTEVDFFETN